MPLKLLEVWAQVFLKLCPLNVHWPQYQPCKSKLLAARWLVDSSRNTVSLGAMLRIPRGWGWGWGWESWFLWPYSVIVTMHELKDSSHCYIMEVFFPLLILDPGTICPAFHASLALGWR